jgi:hypothetical protein
MRKIKEVLRLRFDLAVLGASSYTFAYATEPGDASLD